MAKEYHLKLKGYVGGWNFDADYVDYVLEKNKSAEVHVLINSLGGDVATAFSVSSAFRRHGNVHVHYESMNASAATIASLGAKHISIDKDAMYLVHKCSQMVFMWDMVNADQLQELIDECEKKKKNLDKIDLNIAQAYASRCKKDNDALLDLMKEGGWITAKEALEWGFVDEITDLPEDEKPRMTEDIVDFMAAKGIPVPSVGNKQGLLSRFITALTDMFNNNSTQKIIDTMKKTYVNVCAVLMLEHLESVDGKISVTEDQAQALEDKMAKDAADLSALKTSIANHDKEVADLKAQITAKDQELADLRKQPAASSQQVQGTPAKEQNPASDYFSAVANANELLNQLK